MNSSDSNKKYKRPKQNTQSTTNPESSRRRNNREVLEHEPLEPLCPLLAKDSEWVDILQTSVTGAESSNVTEEEAELQLVECEDGPQMKPLAIMFPGLLEDPQTLEGMLTKAMSTTEVTRHLVDLGEKANFTFMKKANRLIPPEKQWLESLTECSNSHCSLGSGIYSACTSSDYEADNEFPDYFMTIIKGRKKKLIVVDDKDNTSLEDTISKISGPSEQMLTEQSVVNCQPFRDLALEELIRSNKATDIIKKSKQ